MSEGPKLWKRINKPLSEKPFVGSAKEYAAELERRERMYGKKEDPPPQQKSLFERMLEEAKEQKEKDERNKRKLRRGKNKRRKKRKN